jgi:thiol-disulfide isomerase/thioredoxin
MGPGHEGWMNMKRILQMTLKLAAVAAVLYGCVAVAIFLFMRQSNTVAGKALASLPVPAFIIFPMETMWSEARKGALAVGQEAPDFDLASRDGAARVRLSALRQAKPVVLVFGSYTCPPFRKEMPKINQLYRDYKDRVAFYFVYIEEAHARDVWPLKSNAKEKIDYATHQNPGERVQVANTCASKMQIEFPMLVDDMNDSVDRAYSAWPTRLYVVDRDGRIAFKGQPGPFGFKADALRQALTGLVPAGK